MNISCRKWWNNNKDNDAALITLWCLSLLEPRYR